MDEKRKEHRLKAVLAVRLTDEKGREVAAQTTNISRLGAYIEAGCQVPVGKTISLVLIIPGYESVSGSAEVKAEATVFRSTSLRSQPPVFGLGLFFTSFGSTQDRQRLSGYVEYLYSREELGIKDELKRRKSKDTQDVAQQCLDLLHGISRRLDDLSDQIKSLKKK
jgi:hypothetical protein